MNKRPIDKTKKSNIKCEHCEYFDKVHPGIFICKHPNSIKTKNIHYWNKCKLFEWK